jgi:NADPH:quinone reductase-like Zn-dependent oxidoreductase
VKAIVQRSYGGPDVLEFRDVDRPTIGSDEVLVRVRAASINAADWIKLTGKPYLVRPVFGLLRPKQPIAGAAMAGQVEAVGTSVTEFAPGDEVYGEISGAFAEYAKVRPNEIARKPGNLSFDQAAAIPVAGVTALQGLRDQGQLKAGDAALINGASGGVGTLAVQIAKALGATVTGVASTAKVELVRSTGADHVVDYTREDFTTGDRRYDVILDLAGNRSLDDSLRVLKPDGVFVSSVGKSDRTWLGVMPRLIGLRLGARGRSQTVRILAAHQTRTDLDALTRLAEAGQLKPMIDRVFPLGETADALRLFGSGRVQGKVGLAV